MQSVWLSIWWRNNFVGAFVVCGGLRGTKKMGIFRKIFVNKIVAFSTTLLTLLCINWKITSVDLDRMYNGLRKILRYDDKGSNLIQRQLTMWQDTVYLKEITRWTPPEFWKKCYRGQNPMKINLPRHHGSYKEKSQYESWRYPRQVRYPPVIIQWSTYAKYSKAKSYSISVYEALIASHVSS